MSKARGQHAGGLFERPGQLLTGAAVLVYGLWYTFTASSKAHELLVGAAATALSVAFLAQMLRTETLNMELRGRDLVQLWRIPWYILSGCWEITWLLLKDLAGKRAGSYYRDCGFEASRHNPTLIGRSALAVAYTTTAPNFIVIGIDPKQSLMVFHQLDRSTIPKMTKALGAKS